VHYIDTLSRHNPCSRGIAADLSPGFAGALLQIYRQALPGLCCGSIAGHCRGFAADLSRHKKSPGN